MGMENKGAVQSQKCAHCIDCDFKSAEYAARQKDLQSEERVYEPQISLTAETADAELETPQRTPDEIAASFIELVEANPACRTSYRVALLASEAPIDCDSLAAIIDSTPHPATFIQSSPNVVATLVRVGVLSQIILVNGVPYDGSSDDLFHDEAVPDDAEVVFLAQLTEAGGIALAEMAPEKRVRDLLREKPLYAATFLKIVEMAAVPGGAQKEHIEDHLYQNKDALWLDQRTNLPSIYPVYYLNALETAGAIEWNASAGTWVATDAGKSVLD